MCRPCLRGEKGPGLSLLSSPTFQEPLPSRQGVPCPRNVPGPLCISWSLSRAPGVSLASLRPFPTGCSLVRPEGFQLPEQGLQPWSSSHSRSDFDRTARETTWLPPPTFFGCGRGLGPLTCREQARSLIVKHLLFQNARWGCVSLRRPPELCPASSGMDVSHRVADLILRIPTSLSQTRLQMAVPVSDAGKNPARGVHTRQRHAISASTAETFCGF